MDKSIEDQVTADVRTVTTKQFSLKLTGHMLRKVFDFPADAEIVFVVPGGGNWAHSALEINSENPICVNWTETEETRKDASCDD